MQPLHCYFTLSFTILLSLIPSDSFSLSVPTVIIYMRYSLINNIEDKYKIKLCLYAGERCGEVEGSRLEA